jgi:hypothetical protein
MNDLVRLLRDVAAVWDAAQRVTAFWRPSLDLPSWLAPATALAALLGLALATGVAFASIGTLLTALLAAHFLLESVFGVSVSLVQRR